MFVFSGFLINKNCIIVVYIVFIVKLIKVSFEFLILYFEIKNDKNKFIVKVLKNEFIGNINKGVVGKIIIIIIVVKLVFLEIFIILGEVNGFFIIVCIIVFDIVKLLLIIILSNVLGIWYLFKIKLFCVNIFLIVLIGWIMIDFIYKFMNIFIIKRIVIKL